MSSLIQMITIITPKPGKIEQVIEKLAPFNAYVENSELGTLRYELFRQVNGDAEVLVYAEIFKDEAALEAHRSSPEFAELIRSAAEEELLVAAPDTKILKHVGGFASRK